MCEIEITSGIRQGCKGSGNLFLLITYYLIEKLYKSCNGYKNDILNIVVLFFADDGLLLSQNKEDAMKNMLTEIAGECGLQIHKDKSTILVYNSKDQIEEIEGLKITNEIKYLGVSIINQKNCFKKQIEEEV